MAEQLAGLAAEGSASATLAQNIQAETAKQIQRDPALQAEAARQGLNPQINEVAAEQDVAQEAEMEFEAE